MLMYKYVVGPQTSAGQVTNVYDKPNIIIICNNMRVQQSYNAQQQQQQHKQQQQQQTAGQFPTTVNKYKTM